MVRLALLVLLVASTGWASDPVDTAIKKLDDARHFEDGFLASIWGAIETRKLKFLGSADGIWVKTALVRNQFFRNGTFKVAMALTGPKQRAPLVVVLAGLFSDSKGALQMRYLRGLAKRGYHVMLVANSWSAEFLEQGPRFKPAEFALEAQAALDTISSAVEHIGPKYVDGISVLGESYGGFLASTVLVRNFIFPEEDLKPSREQFDIGFWLKTARARNPRIPIRILTSEDDVLNEPYQWQRNGFFRFSEVNLSVLSWGGHVGFVMAREFRLVLNALFGPPSEEPPPPMSF